MAISHSRLMAALRQKYPGGPGQVLRRLGLDENGNALSGAHAAKIIDHLQGKLDAEQMAEFGLLLDQLGASTVARDDEPEQHEALARFLRGTGLDERYVREALDMVPKPAVRAASDRRLKAEDAALDMDDFDARFGGSHIGIGFGSPGAEMAYDAPRAKPVSDKDVADFDRSFPESARLAGRSGRGGSS